MATYIKIATVTVGAGGQASIAFSSIPSTYTDLVLSLSLRTDRSSVDDFLNMSINGSTTSFTYKAIDGNGSSSTSYGGSTTRIGQTDGNTATASTFSSTQIYLPNYSGSNNKSYSVESVAETNATLAYMTMFANLWSNPAAINALSITSGFAANFMQYSSATLYGISKS